MKKLLIIPMFFACYFGFGQTIDSASIIGYSIKIGKLVVAQNDLINYKNWNDKMPWRDATDACKLLGNGWRLPTRAELNILYKNKGKIGGFTDDYYWSSTENNKLYGQYGVWLKDFGKLGYEVDYTISSTYRVRAVRSLN
jgi:hypothetical protein